MKKLLSLLIALAMLVTSLTVLADAPKEAVAEASKFVPADAKLTSTGEDANTLELTFKDSKENQYRVYLSKSPLLVMRVNMKSADEAGGKQIGLEEPAVRALVEQNFPGSVVSQVFVETKGEDELYFVVLFERQGQFYKVRFNAANGRMTHYVMRGVPQMEKMPGVGIKAAQAMQLALEYAGGGVVTDIQLGRVKAGAQYLVQVRNQDKMYAVLLNALDGSLVQMRVKDNTLMDFPQLGTTLPPAVVIPGQWDADWGDDDWYDDFDDLDDDWDDDDWDDWDDDRDDDDDDDEEDDDDRDDDNDDRDDDNDDRDDDDDDDRDDDDDDDRDDDDNDDRDDDDNDDRDDDDDDDDRDDDDDDDDRDDDDDDDQDDDDDDD